MALTINRDPNGDGPDDLNTTTGATETTKPGKRTKPPKVKKVKPARSASDKARRRAIVLPIGVAIVAAAALAATVKAATPATIPVAVLKTPISANTPADASMFTIIDVAATDLDGAAILAEQLDGKTWYAEEDLQVGDKATDANFNSTSRIDIATLPDPNLKGQTIRIEQPENAFNFKIRPGDYVDVLLTSNTGDTPFSDFILTKVLVIDVAVASTPGQAINPQTGAPLEGAEQAAGNMYTIALNPQQTKILASAKAAGALSLVLSRADAPTAGADTATEVAPSASATPTTVLPEVTAPAATPTSTPTTAATPKPTKTP